MRDLRCSVAHPAVSVFSLEKRAYLYAGRMYRLRIFKIPYRKSLSSACYDKVKQQIRAVSFYYGR